MDTVISSVTLHHKEMHYPKGLVFFLQEIFFVHVACRFLFMTSIILGAISL